METCTICNMEPCECEISEDDYEYGEPEEEFSAPAPDQEASR